MINEWLAIVYGLTSAAVWGAGDFAGGLATKRTPALMVVIFSQIAGVLGFILAAILFGEPWPSTADVVWGVLAGLAGAVGLMALYRGLATGQMGVVASLAAVVSALLPMLVGLLLEGWPGPFQLVGFALALAAVWVVSFAGQTGRFALATLQMPLIAGVGFALFFILIDRVSAGALFWPLAAARLASITTLSLVAATRRQWHMPPLKEWPLIALTGVCDAGGNLFFVLATQAGRLDIASILSSLYPASTVLLARLVLHERLSPRQWVGVGVALLAVVLIAL